MSYSFWNGFLTKCLETQTLLNFESPMITTAPAWRPSLLHRKTDCPGGGGGCNLFPARCANTYFRQGVQITNTYFRQYRQHISNQRRDSDCLQYLNFCKLQYQISNIVNSHYRDVDWMAVAGNSGKGG